MPYFSPEITHKVDRDQWGFSKEIYKSPKPQSEVDAERAREHLSSFDRRQAEDDAHAAWMQKQQRAFYADYERRQHAAALGLSAPDVRRSLTKPQTSPAIRYDDTRTAWHECGHMTLCALQNIAVLRASTEPDPSRDSNGSVTHSDQATDEQRLLILCGGRGAEIIGLGNAGDGTERDMRTAREIALRIAGGDVDQAEIVLDGYCSAASQLLTKHGLVLRTLVEALLQRRTIEAPDTDALIAGALAQDRVARKRRRRAQRRAAQRSVASGTGARTLTAGTARTQAERALFEQVYVRNDGHIL